MHHIIYLFLLTILSGCLGPSYFWQSINGHFDLLSKRVPIQKLIDAKTTSAKLKQQLEKTVKYRAFAEKTLLLPTKGTFNSYADLKRHKATWVVFASQPYKLAPKKWCFPVTGCLNYLGYFNEADAHKHGDKLKNLGMDVYIDGSPAYSTLGWFDDPLLNTFINYADEKLLALIFHELAHQKLYIADDPTLNESYAVAVSQIGVTLWFEGQGNSADILRINKQLKQKNNFINNVQTVRKQLAALYTSPLDITTKQRQKEAILKAVGKKYAHTWPKEWFSKGLNNAKLNSANTYSRLVPQIMAVFNKEGRDIVKFHKTIEKISKSAPAKREAILNSFVGVSDG
ncbi:MAG: aminopeptidase [Magnetococcales bacterium]|nr:aminopeptidase [Magnetococcales bacterium]